MTAKKKFKLVYLDTYVKGGKPRLSWIWHKNASDYNSWLEKPRSYSHFYSYQYLQDWNTGIDFKQIMK